VFAKNCFVEPDARPAGEVEPDLARDLGHASAPRTNALPCT
jgi:hypothetical protein